MVVLGLTEEHCKRPVNQQTRGGGHWGRARLARLQRREVRRIADATGVGRARLRHYCSSGDSPSLPEDCRPRFADPTGAPVSDEGEEEVEGDEGAVAGTEGEALLASSSFLLSSIQSSRVYWCMSRAYAKSA